VRRGSKLTPTILEPNTIRPFWRLNIRLRTQRLKAYQIELLVYLFTYLYFLFFVTGYGRKRRSFTGLFFLISLLEIRSTSKQPTFNSLLPGNIYISPFYSYFKILIIFENNTDVFMREKPTKRKLKNRKTTYYVLLVIN
jgi:hypothetical protein